MTGPEQRTIVITGASSGIGKACAKVFANMGWHVIATGRDPERCDQAESDIAAVASDRAKLDFLRGDFALMSEVSRIASEVGDISGRVDVLINNAGGVRDQLYKTSEGLEATFATNHVAAFLLTRKLMPQLEHAAQASPPGRVRVLAVSSTGHAASPGMRWNDLNHFDEFDAGSAYLHAKLANVLFTRELDRRVKDMGIAAHAVVPGAVHSNFASHADPSTQAYMAGLEGATPEQAARTLVWMATSPDTALPGGRFFRELEEVEIAPQGLDLVAAARLWTETEKILEQIGIQAEKYA